MALIDDLVAALTVLPGLRSQSAQRMALHLLQRDRSGGVRLSTALSTLCVMFVSVGSAATRQKPKYAVCVTILGAKSDSFALSSLS